MHNNWLWRLPQISEEDGNAATFEYGSRDCAFFEATRLCLDGVDLVDAMFPVDVMSMTW